MKDDKALEEYRETHKNKKYQVTRLKGLGELDADETSILVDPDKRIIRQVTVADAKEADKLFDALMGEAITPRKQFIKEHAQEVSYVV